VAVTALEAALRCPFFAFAVNVLKAARKDPVSDAIGTRERGSLLHEALARALEATRSLSGLRSPAELTELGMAAARTYVLTRGRTPLRRIGLESTLCDVRSMLVQIFASADEVGFRFAEQAFGDGATWPALAAGGTRLAGRIDRIDQSADGAKVRVIDYKTNLPKLDDTQLQPWLYAHKAASELGATEVEFAYFSLEKRSPKLKVVYQGGPLGEPVAIALERAQRVAEQLGRGGVAARPSSPAHCPRCDARDICRRPLSAPAPEADD
jgi:hypothetical protein